MAILAGACGSRPFISSRRGGVLRILACTSACFFLGVNEPGIKAVEPIPNPATEGAVEGSEFAADAELRDPFWPIGYMSPSHRREGPEHVLGAASGEKQAKAFSKLRCGGTIKCGDKIFANVNGTIVEEGDIVAVTVGGELFRFRVCAIGMDGIKFKSAY